MLTAKEQKKRVKQFIDITKDWKEEEQYEQRFWMLFLSLIFGETDVNYLVFEKPVFDVITKTIRKIDVYIPSTKVIIEHKSWGLDLDVAWKQALNYNNNLPADEKAKWIIVSDFERIIVYDMTKDKFPSKTFYTRDLEKDYSNFNFIVDSTVVELPDTSFDVSKRAGEIVAEIYNAVFDEYPVEIDKDTKLKNLNKFCVRLVFCFYAEDAGLFAQKDQFYNYMSKVEVKNWRFRLKQLFEILNTPIDAVERLYLDDDLRAFPYVNGGLFEGDVELPQFTKETVELILKTASGNFDWSQISPTIFGAMFESTLNPETRHQGGMHYTSIENIHKVIDPLFLDNLKTRLEEIKGFSISQRTRALREYQDYLASLKFLDPACGSGNFLTEAYICIRKLENEVLEILLQDQMAFNDYAVKVSIKQFYGIEINDFAVSVAMTALWIAESQMFEESQRILNGNKEFLPLKTNGNINEGNALTLDWNDVIKSNELTYIMGNPPFVGNAKLTDAQKKEREQIFSVERAGDLDYVSCWYKKAQEYIKNTSIKCAFVSTNSICQGQQVVPLWEDLFADGLVINFAYTSFNWESEVKDGAQVVCIIIGFSYINDSDKKLFNSKKGTNEIVENINAYLLPTDNIFVKKQRLPISDVPIMLKGLQPTDNGYLILSDEEKCKLVKAEPKSEKWIKQFVTAREYIKNQKRWCLWLKDISPSELSEMPLVRERVKCCKEWRSNQKESGDAYKLKDIPTQFRGVKNYRLTDFIIIPRHTSSNREYIPFGFADKDCIAGDSISYIPDADYFMFGVLSSKTHLAWVSAICGRLGDGYRYASDVVYNTFIFCEPSEIQRTRIEESAKAIISARNKYLGSSLEDLYDPIMMPIELRKAHEENDKAVWEAYGKAWEFGNEAECVAYLMKLYEQKVKEK